MRVRAPPRAPRHLPGAQGVLGVGCTRPRRHSEFLPVHLLSFLRRFGVCRVLARCAGCRELLALFGGYFANTTTQKRLPASFFRVIDSRPMNAARCRVYFGPLRTASVSPALSSYRRRPACLSSHRQPRARAKAQGRRDGGGTEGQHPACPVPYRQRPAGLVSVPQASRLPCLPFRYGLLTRLPAVAGRVLSPALPCALKHVQAENLSGGKAVKQSSIKTWRGGSPRRCS